MSSGAIIFHETTIEPSSRDVCSKTADRRSPVKILLFHISMTIKTFNRIDLAPLNSARRDRVVILSYPVLFYEKPYPVLLCPIWNVVLVLELGPERNGT